MFIVAGVAAVAAAATLADLIWYRFGVQHTMVAGVLHGALLLMTVGGVLGAVAGRPRRGLVAGVAAGVGGALSYYALVLVMDPRPYGTAIPGAWLVMWLLLAALDGRWLRAPAVRPWSRVAARGGSAAAASGIAFVLVVDLLWRRPVGEDRSYLLQFAAWAFAWAPGLLALTLEPPGAAAATGRGRDGSIAPGDLWSRIERGEPVHILDVRSEAEFAAGHVPGAVNVPFNRVPAEPHRVPGAPGDELFVYCGHGPRAHIAAAALHRQGRTRITYVAGHFAGWRRAGLAVEAGPGPGGQTGAADR